MPPETAIPTEDTSVSQLAPEVAAAQAELPAVQQTIASLTVQLSAAKEQERALQEILGTDTPEDPDPTPPPRAQF